MTDTQGMSQSQDVSAPPVVPSQPAAAPSAPVPSSDEKIFKQSEVNSIVGREKARAIEEYRRMQTEQPDYVRQKYGDAGNQQPNQPPSAIPSQDEIKRLAAEEIQRHRDEWMNEARSRSEQEFAQKTVQNFYNKIAPGKEKYQDFDAVTGEIELIQFPNVVRILAESVENSHDVLYELGKDLSKIEILESLASRSPKAAVIQAQRLAKSLKENEAAGKMRVPNEPLGQMRPSNTGTDNGVMGVKDYRAKWRV